MPSPPIERTLDIPADEALPEIWWPLTRVDRQWSERVPGVLTFRGSPTRSFHGEGPLPVAPEVLWRYPDRPMCSESTDETGTQLWCGTGWTGQPAVWERGGQLLLAVGAMDRSVHLLNALTGTSVVAPFETDDIIKGSLTVDPDGYPLIYTGSRDGMLRVLAFDGPEMAELWSLDSRSVSPRLWNDDWDGAPIVLHDHLLIGGENSNFHVVKLRRGFGSDGRVVVDPELIAVVPGWDDALLAQVGENVSIESSVSLAGNLAWFANSGGLVQAWDLSGLATGEPLERVFRFWMGDDTDASLVHDADGFVYAASEYERGTERSRDLGQVVKLDPTKPDDPVVWSAEARQGLGSGVWGTPALWRDLVIVAASDGRLIGLDRDTGATRWTLELQGPMWSSPVVVDDVLLQGDCGGLLRAYGLRSGAPPQLRWEVGLPGCIESTPTVWKGNIWVGTRGGYVFRIGDG